MSDIKITEVSYEQFTDYEFIPPSSFFCKSALGIYYFFHTASRAKAQHKCNEMFDGKYTVIASKIQKGKGTVTAVGH